MTDTHDSGLGMGRVLAIMIGFLIVGAPMVFYLWTTINELLAGHWDGSRFLVSLVVLAVFAGLLVFLSRVIHDLDEQKA